MKKRLARSLRRFADRVDPAGRNPIVEMRANWTRTGSPHIHLDLIGGHRMHGYVVPDDEYLAAQLSAVPLR